MARTKKPIPSITVTGKQIIVAGCNWRPNQKEVDTMESLVAVSFSAATLETPGGFVFKSSQAAKKAFGAAFTEPEKYSLDSLPDATRWYDPVGMGALVEAVVNGKGN